MIPENMNLMISQTCGSNDPLKYGSNDSWGCKPFYGYGYKGKCWKIYGPNDPQKYEFNDYWKCEPFCEHNESWEYESNDSQNVEKFMDLVIHINVSLFMNLMIPGNVGNDGGTADKR